MAAGRRLSSGLVGTGWWGDSRGGRTLHLNTAAALWAAAGFLQPSAQLQDRQDWSCCTHRQQPHGVPEASSFHPSPAKGQRRGLGEHKEAMQASVEGEQQRFCWSRSCPGLCYPTQRREERLGLQTGRRHQQNAPVSGVPSAVYLILSLRAGVISAPQAGRGKMKAPWAGTGPRLGAPPVTSPFVPGVTELAGGQPQETVLGGRDGCDLVTQPLPSIWTKAAPRCGKTRAQSGVPIPSSHCPQVGCRTPPLPQLAPAFVLMLCSFDLPVKA